jgi:hypothetical protein
MTQKEKTKITDIVVISDLHCGDQLGICPDRKIKLDAGGYYKPNKIQKKIWKHYLRFINEFIPEVTQGRKFILVVNGDVIEGVHHRATHQISHNLKDQENIAVETLEPLISLKNCSKIFFIRGTEAHSGPASECEERIAERVKAEKDEKGNYSRYTLWLEFGTKNILCNFAHHIGVTNTSAYESTAVLKELIEAYVVTGRYNLKPPAIVVRSHRHKFISVTLSGTYVNAISLVTPSWQAFTPFMSRNIQGRVGLPEIGGVIIREGKEVPLYFRTFIKAIERDKVVRL